MPKCPDCEGELEELTEITGYHYWMCGNSDCKMSYRFYRNAAQQSAQVDIPCPYCHSKTPGIHNPNCQYVEFFNSPHQ